MLDFRKRLNWLRLSLGNVEFEDPADEFMACILEGLAGIVQQEDWQQPFIIIITQTNYGSILVDYVDNSTGELESVCVLESKQSNGFLYYLFNSVIEKFKEQDFEVTMCNDSAYVYVP